MTDANQPKTDTSEGNAGERRPDQGGASAPGKQTQDPATGGEGAAGAGGSKGFGTGN